jgi:fimbrial isopeptide formation D2 family protein/uncharacterized repeat protein (TIGR01451 family)/LPXTG-motif cell wall-anchored protein
MESRYRAVARPSSTSLGGRLRALLVLVVSMLLAWAGLAAAPIAAADGPAATITKTIDDPKSAYDKGDTVTYRLNIQCSSLEDPCVTGVVTDVLDSNLSYTSYSVSRKTVDGETSAVPIVLVQSGQTLTWNVGVAGADESKWFLEGETFDIVVNAKVKSVPGNAERTIDNQASVSAAGGSPNNSKIVTIVVNPPAPSVYDWGLVKSKTAPSGNPVVGGNVTYDIRFTRPAAAGGGKPVAGGVDISSFTLTDALPTGATYVSATIEGASGSANYDSATNSVTFPNTTLSAESMYCGNPCITWYVVHLTVNYPADTFHAEDKPVNKVTAVVQYADGHPADTLKAEAEVTLKDEIKTLYGTKFAVNMVNPVPGEKVSWVLQTRNTGNVVQPEVILTDVLPAHVDSVQVEAGDWYMPKQDGGGDFEYTMDGTTWLPLGSLSHSTNDRLDVPAGATSVRMILENLRVDDYGGFRVYGTLAADTPVGTVVNNCMHYPYLGTSDASVCASLVVKAKPQATIIPLKSHLVSDGGNKVKPGDEFQWLLEWNTRATTVPTTSTITDLLPSQFELVTENAPCLEFDGYWTTATGDDCVASATTPAYTTEPVAGGTLITFNNIALPAVPSQYDYKYRIRLHVRVKDGAAAGSYTNRMTVALPDAWETTCYFGGAAPCAATDSVAIDSAAAVGVQKWDKGTEPNVAQDTGKASTKCPNWDGFTRYPCVAQTLPGGDLTYRLKWANQGNVPLTNAIVYDILPYVGDTGVSQTLAGSSRKTEWVPVLSGPITLDAALSTATGSNYVVEYNLTTNPCRPELQEGTEDGVWQTGCDDTWVTSVSDWSSVKSFRVKAYQADGSTWDAGTRLVFTIPMTAPADAAKSKVEPLDLSVAWNSVSQRAFQVKADGSKVRLQATEPRKVGVIIPAPYVSIGDYVWYDANYNGKQDSGETPAEGIKVTLKDAGGATVATTTTDADGYYWFQNLTEKTDYTLVFEKPAGYNWTTRNSGTDDAIDSDVNPATDQISFTSPTWVSGVSHNLGGHDAADDPTLDAGLVLPHPLVSVGDYVWFDTNRDGLQSAGEKPVKDVVVNLYNAAGEKVDSTTTNTAGYYWFTGLLAGEDYTVEFVKPAGATFTAVDAGGITSNSPTGDLNDSDAPADGKVSFTAEASGDNEGGADVTDNPGIDAGFIQYNLELAKELDTTGVVHVGDTVSYTLTPVNDGPVDALAGWSVTDLLPAGLTQVSMSGTGYTCIDSTCTSLAGLAAGERGAPITVTATVDAGASGSLKNVAWVDKAGVDVPETNPLVVPTLDTNTRTSETDNDAEAVVTLTPLVSIGDYVWYDNNRDGQQSAGEPAYPGMIVNLYADGSTTVLASTTTDGDGYYFFANLEPDTKYTVEFVKGGSEVFTAKNLGATASDSNPVVSTGKADVTTPSDGSNLTGHGQTDDPTIDAGIIKYNLVLAKALTSSGPYYKNGEATFTLTPKNEGPADAATGWSVTDVLPTGLTLKTMSGAGYTCSGNTCVAQAGLAAGAEGGPITLVVTIDDGFVGTAHNVAYVSPADSDGPETNPLTIPTRNVTNTSTTPTDNDAQADLVVASLVSIGDYVWFDTDRDGQQEAGESPVPNVTVNLYRDGDTTPWKTTTTDAAGFYSFTDLTPGDAYTVEFVKPAGTMFTSQNTGADVSDSDADVSTGKVSVTAPASGDNSATTPDDPTIDAGLVKLVSVGDYVWWDTDRDGSQDAAEKPVPGVTVNLYDVTGALVKSTTTDGEGFYSFNDLVPAGRYTVEFVKPANTVFTWQNTDGVLDSVDSDADRADGRVGIIAPETGENSLTEPDDPTIDAGLIKLVSIGDYVWWDNDRDGQQGDELPVPGVTVNLLDASGNLLDTTTTDEDGFYSFTDLLAGASYQVVFVKPANTVFTDSNVGDDASDSDPNPLGLVLLVAPSDGANSASEPDDPTIDAGLVKLVSIGDYVWWDNNRDGLQTEGEPVVPGVTVNLYDAEGALVKSTTTDGEGFYSFNNLFAESDYTVEFVKPEGTWFTSQDTPQDDAVDSDADLGTGRVDIVTPADGQNSLETPDDPTIDAGLVQLNLSIVKTLLTTKTVHPGSTVKYELVPYNDGPSDALAGWTVTELLPSGLKLVAMEGLGYTCDIVTATCTSASPLPAGTAGATITVTTKVKPGVKGRQWNVAYVSPSVDEVVETNPLDVVPTNDTDTDLTTTDNDDQAVVNVKAIVADDDDGDGDDLAYTGSDAVGLLGFGALALVAGGGLLLMRRRRSVD